MAKHTPGPWMIYDDGDDEDSSDIINVWIDDRDGGEKYDIAAMLLDRPVGERKANARLIAAAPDLLAALEGLVGWFGLYGYLLHTAFDSGEIDESQLDWLGLHKVLDNATAAIAKARGGE